ncbi:heavy metal-associated isoprenylated plant protein 36-like isoform X2 [Durio zibethinus]|uniref:Heavy metal-associated isoprenylated plant protein 36-like isoform X2 n=1 Tax=Durio zibethinus TaxID=66656 RepID=A0A6P6A0C1_DURZI|nr:heavy metal-associated isoprenylated plant protein 36-like isoform X2 [Durio zibethinus]
MGDYLNVPTCVLKVNIQCCAACPKKVKKKLQKINGVYAIDIDTKNGMVSVRGIVQPSILIQTISEKVGKKAELYSFEKNPKIQNEMLDQGNSCSACKYEEKNQTCSFTTDESNDHDQAVLNEVKDPIPEVPEGSLSWHQTQHRLRKKKHRFAGWIGKKSTVEPRMFGNFGGPRPGYSRLPHAATVPPLSPPTLPPPSYR